MDDEIHKDFYFDVLVVDVILTRIMKHVILLQFLKINGIFKEYKKK